MGYELNDALLPVNPRLVETLDEEWRRFGRPGTWWTGAERLAIAVEARRARSCELCRERKASPSPVAGGDHAASGPLPEAAVAASHRIASDPGHLSSEWYDGVWRGA